MSPNRAVTTVLPRLGWMTCSAARVPTNTHSHQVLPLTRTEVSSEQTTGLASTTFSIAAVAASSGCRARARMLLIAPSLIDSEKSSLKPLHADGMGVMQIDNRSPGRGSDAAPGRHRGGSCAAGGRHRTPTVRRGARVVELPQ